VPTDPVIRLAKLRIVKASADLEVQLGTKTGSAPAIHILHCLQDRAAESLAALAFVDAEDARQIRTFQNEVKKYDEWVVWLRELIADGKRIAQEFDDDARNEMLDVLLETPEGQRQAIELGLVDDIPRDS
jgi:hypothetical protein